MIRSLPCLFTIFLLYFLAHFDSYFGMELWRLKHYTTADAAQRGNDGITFYDTFL
jgi:hypothetical protein